MGVNTVAVLYSQNTGFSAKHVCLGGKKSLFQIFMPLHLLKYPFEFIVQCKHFFAVDFMLL